MRRRGNNRGFTLAELLIVVAIIAILSDVSFIAVHTYQVRMAKLECDSIAKEIFFAAQNHLTLAKGQEYLGLSNEAKEFGSQKDEGEKDVYYFIYNVDSLNDENTVFGQMLPFGSLDETVRAGGSYIVRYNPETARILDVYYCATNGRFKHHFVAGDYGKVRSEYQEGTIDGNFDNNKRTVIGWYGGDDKQGTGIRLEPPSIQVINKEKLFVKVSEIPEKADTLKLIIKGKTSKAEAAITLKDEKGSYIDDLSGSMPYRAKQSKEERYPYIVILDDLTTQNFHFADINNVSLHNTQLIELNSTLGLEFIPGEDIEIWAVVYKSDEVSNVPESTHIIENSLFGKIQNLNLDSETDPEYKATISNFRHLENLGKSISDVELNITAAEQIAHLDWNGFIRNVTGDENGRIAIHQMGEGIKEPDNHFLPIDVTGNLKYDGKIERLIDKNKEENEGKVSYEISNVTIVSSEKGGLFKELYGVRSTEDGDFSSSISNLTLINFNVAAEDNAGALAGLLDGVKVSNVSAYHDLEKGEEASINSSGSEAGGLIGEIKNSEIEYCSASLYVDKLGDNAPKNAGGLIGSAENTVIRGCYSGGHTQEGNYDASKININGKEAAGGLIGKVKTTDILYSYSTCSVSASDATGNAGGFVGDLDGKSSFKYSYSTGLVSGGNKKGAFAGGYTDNVEYCWYYEIINELVDEEEITYLSAMPLSDENEEMPKGIGALDADFSTYKNFEEQYLSSFGDAVPYDEQLEIYYKKDEQPGTYYVLPNVFQMGAEGNKEDYTVSTHYGDWPAPEIFVLNTAS